MLYFLGFSLDVLIVVFRVLFRGKSYAGVFLLGVFGWFQYISMFIQIGKCRFRFCVAAVVGLCHETILEDVCLSVGPEFKGPFQGNA